MNISHAFFTHSSVPEHLGSTTLAIGNSNAVNRCLWNADVYSMEQILRSGFAMPFLGISEASTPISTVIRLVSIPTRSVDSVPFVQVYSMCFQDDCCSDWDMRELECRPNLH